jgi:hypothetical protein
MRRLALLAVLAFTISGCSNLTAQSADGKVSATGMPWDSVVDVGQGPGCVVPDPYVPPPAPTPSPIVLSQHSLCDAGGGNCHPVMMSERMAADPATVCNVAYAQSKGPGAAAWIGGLGAIVAAILTLAGSSGL